MSESTDDFAALFEASIKAKRIEQGQTIEGTIVGLGPDVAFVDVGGKGEAEIDIEELKDADGDIEVNVGDRIQAVVVSTSGGLKLSRKLARGAATLRQLEDAYQTGLPVEGRVEKAVKGGFEVRIAGQRAFCPFSQIDIVRGTDAAMHEGKVYTFRISEYKEGGRNLVVSRRALLEEDQRSKAVEVKASIVPGAVLAGRVASVREFGAFIDLGGGVQGLLHISEMGWSRVSDPSQIMKPGEPITVKVLQVDEARQKISLGLKQLTDDPWASVATKYQPGQVLAGRVTRITEFGAFIELEPGVEGLAHVSTFPPTGRAGGWKADVNSGTDVAVEVLSVEPDKKRIGVAVVPEGSSRAASATKTSGEIVPGARLKGKVERHEKFGVFVFLAPGRTGLVPNAETGIPREGDIAKAFPVGSDIDVVVLEVDESSRRIRLSVKAIADAQEAAEVQDYTQREKSAADSQGFGSLGDKLRGALKR